MKGKSIFVLIGIVLLFSIEVQGHFIYNEGGMPFCSECGNKAQELVQNDIPQMIVDGGKYFLKSGSHFNDCLSILEGGKRLEKALDEIRKAIVQLKLAQKQYEQLAAKARDTRYVDSAIAKLVMFNYDSFQSHRVLIPYFFSIVRNYLAKGDVRGLYDYNVELTSDLVILFEMIERDLSSGVFDISTVWDANQSYMKVKFVGQYAAMVFNKIH